MDVGSRDAYSGRSYPEECEMTSRATRFTRTATLLPALLATAAPALVFAHPGSGLGVGFAHPLSGLDHVVAMLAIGLWASQLGGRALLWIPLSSLALVAAGGLLASAGGSLPGVEVGIALSVVALGLLLAGAARLPQIASALLVGGFALCHGHAHGNELSATASGAEQVLGFLAATALLHGFGIAAAQVALRAGAAPLVRTSGAAITLCGAWLVWGFGA